MESGAEQFKGKDDKKATSTQSSRSCTPILANSATSDAQKRPLNSPDLLQAKRPKHENSYSLSSSYVSGSRYVINK